MLTAETFPRWVERAVQLLSGPGFGHDGRTPEETVVELVSRGLGRQDAYFVTLAGQMLARERDIPVRTAKITPEERVARRYSATKERP